MSVFRLALLLVMIDGLVFRGPAASAETAGDLQVYALGPGDEISLRVLGSTDFPDKPFRIDPNGEIALPLIGRVHAAGRTQAALEAEITQRLRTYIKKPQVSINITQYGSQPVSVLGSVTAPGIYQLSGTMTLAQVLALAKGLTPDAGGEIRIASYDGDGMAPGGLSNKTPNPKITSVRVEDLLSSSTAVGGILIRPHDVITVPKAEVVYVIGEVHKPGMHVLVQRQSVSVLEALSLAEGTLPTAAPQHSKILRREPTSNQRREIPVDLKSVLAGRSENMTLQPDDILVVPGNAAKSVGLRSIEAAIQLGTGVVIWRH